MIRIICGGKKNAGAALEIIEEFEKRLRKPYELRWEFCEEEKLMQRLKDWPFERSREHVVCCDERGNIISSDEYSQRLTRVFEQGLDVVILIGGAYGFSHETRERADFVWSFSKLVFPHQLFRVMVTEQIYRAQEIAKGSKYHHM